MRGTVHTHHRGRWARSALLVLIALGALLAAAPAAWAFDPIDVECANGANTMHGDSLLSTTCYSCHGVAYPVEPIAPVDTTKCLQCHWGGYKNRTAPSLFTKCWNCHYPGENQDDVQSSDGCAAATDCHAVDPAVNLPHYGANTKGCVDGCHRTSAQSLPNGSPHHDNGLPSCYDCHDGAQAAEKVHEPYAAARDLTNGGPYPYCHTCHAGYDVTHPAPTAIVERTMTATAVPLTVAYGGTTVVSGTLFDGATPVVGAAITLLGRPVLAIDWLSLQLKTTTSTGKFTFDAVKPAKNTTYGAMTKGKVDGARVLKPRLAKVDVKVAPIVKETLNKTSLTLGGTITVTGKVEPSKTGGKVKWVFQRYVDGAWKTVTTTTAKLLTDVDVPDPGVDYSQASFTYKPGTKGSWRVKTTFVATIEYTTASSVYKTFTVK